MFDQSSWRSLCAKNHNNKQVVTPLIHKLQHLKAGAFRCAYVVYFKDMLKGMCLIASWNNKFILWFKGVQQGIKLHIQELPVF